MNIQRKIVVRGKVQGVGFRNATWRKAMELGTGGLSGILMTGVWKSWLRQPIKNLKFLKIGAAWDLLMQGWTALKFLNWIKQVLKISALIVEIFINRFNIKKRLN